MKDDTISRQAAIDKFEPWLKVDGYSEGELNMLKAVLYELRVMPSAQPEIVRCKDCKYSSPNKVYGCRFEPFDTCENGGRMYSDDYCSRAERRTDE